MFLIRTVLKECGWSTCLCKLCIIIVCVSQRIVCSIRHRENVIVFRSLQFNIKIGDKTNQITCKKALKQTESVMVDFTTNNGVEWKLLRHLDPFTLNDQPEVISITLPKSAKTNSTAFRWWQPILSPGHRHSYNLQ